MRERCRQLHITSETLGNLRQAALSSAPCCMAHDDHEVSPVDGGVKSWQQELKEGLRSVRMVRVHRGNSPTSHDDSSEPPTELGEVPSAGNSPSTVTQVEPQAWSTTVNQRQVFLTFPPDRLSPSAGLRELYAHSAISAFHQKHHHHQPHDDLLPQELVSVLDAPVSQICRVHHRGPRCKFGDECRYIHLCRDLSRHCLPSPQTPTPQASPSLTTHLSPSQVQKKHPPQMVGWDASEVGGMVSSFEEDEEEEVAIGTPLDTTAAEQPLVPPPPPVEQQSETVAMPTTQEETDNTAPTRFAHRPYKRSK